MTMEQDYLDFDELITFLEQKGYKWNTRRTTDLLLEAITDSKLTPVFFYRGEITATYAKFVGANKWEEVKKDTCRLQGYFSANAYDLVDLYQDYFTCVPNCLTLNGQHVRPYKIFGNPAPVATDHQKRTEGIDTCFLHLSCGSFIEGYGHTVSEFLYPVEQLDSMFDRSNRDQLAIQLEEGTQQKLEGTQNIPAQQVKAWLASNNYIYKGFNDNIPADPITQVKELTDAQATIKRITNDYEKPQAKAELADAAVDDKELSGLAKYNANKAYIKTTAKAIASYIWSMDTEQAIRTGDMVQQIRHVMHNVEPELLPDDKAIRTWLSDIAPNYAKKGGKTSKNAPNEISLIMKK